MLRDINSFLPVLVIDIDGDLRDPKTEVLVHLPALPSKGDTLAFQTGSEGDRAEAVVVDLAVYTRESSPTPLQAYVYAFVSYTQTRKELEKKRTTLTATELLSLIEYLGMTYGAAENSAVVRLTEKLEKMREGVFRQGD